MENSPDSTTSSSDPDPLEDKDECEKNDMCEYDPKCAFYFDSPRLRGCRHYQYIPKDVR